MNNSDDQRVIKNSWLEEYLRYTEPHESPVIFHTWMGVSVLASTLERNVIAYQGTYKVFPNLYVITVAEPGVCFKTAAMDVAYELIYSVVPRVNIFAQKITPEALIQRLSRQLKMKGNLVVQPSASIVRSSELSVFLGKDAYKSGLIGILTDLYDCPERPWAYETKHGGEEVLRDVCVNLVGATTPDGLRLGIPQDALGMGLISRILFIYAEQSKPPRLFTKEVNGKLEWKKFSVGRKKKLTADLGRIRRMTGLFEWTEQAKVWWEEWYPKRYLKDELSNTLKSYLGRKHVMVIKLAMVLSASESDELIIKANHLMEGLRMLNDIEEGMEKVLKPLAASSSGTILQRVLDFIEKHREVDRTMLLRTFSSRLLAKELDDIVRTLLDAKLIGERIEEKKGARRGYTKKFYHTLKSDIEG